MMKKNMITKLLILFFVKIAVGQIINRGNVYISQDTDVSFVNDFNNTTTGEFWNNGSIYSYGNWNNDGIIDFSIFNVDKGLTSFIGTEEQVISGTSFSYFYDVLFDNLSGLAFNLQGNISISNESDFTFGIVDNKLTNGILIFEEDSYHIGVSNDSHVNGAVVKEGNDRFDFPIGNGNYYRRASISEPSLSNDIFIGEYFFENTNNKYPVNNLDSNLIFIDNTEYWIIEESSEASQVFLTLFLSDGTTPNEILTAPLETIHIARWDNEKQLWIDQGGVQEISSQSVSSLVKNYGVFTLAKVEDNDKIDFPLFFTPNGDGYNDVWNINPPTDIEIISIRVFDRFGKLLKELNPESKGWDGTFNGEKLPSSDYWFLINYNDLEDDTKKQLRSHFSLKL